MSGISRNRIASALIWGCAIVAVMTSACGPGSTPYWRIHDAALTSDGAAIVLLVESGDWSVTSNVFASARTYSAKRLTLWRLLRASASLKEWKGLELPAGFRPFYSGLSLAQFNLGVGALEASLPNCQAVLTDCAIRRTPAPYVARDIVNGSDRGLQLVDPESGVRVRVVNDGLASSNWDSRTPDAASLAKDSAMRDVLKRVLDRAELRRLKFESASDTGASERGTTFVDSEIGDATEGVYAEYRVDAADTITARVQYGGDAPFTVRWQPSTDATSAACESDRPQIERWLPGCRFISESEELDPELAYVVSTFGQLQASARTDPAYISASRGATFGVRHTNEAQNFTWVDCVGLPASRVGGCDVTEGDTVCSEKLPLLCVNLNPTDELPAGVRRERWLAARMSASAPIRGDGLATSGDASAVCAGEFGQGWRVATVKDHGDGFIAHGSITRARRLWIDVPDTPKATCWQARGRHNPQ